MNSQPSVRERVIEIVRGRTIEQTRSSCAQSAGPLLPNAAVRGAKGIFVEQFCPDCWARRVAYVEFSRVHGWAHVDAPKPRPRGECEGCVEVRVPWSRVRQWMDEAEHGQQLDLLAGAGS